MAFFKFPTPFISLGIQSLVCRNYKKLVFNPFHMQECKDRLLAKIEAQENLTDDQWKEIRQEFLNSSLNIRGMKENNVDSSILQICDKNCDFNVTKSYVDFLRRCNGDVNLHVIGNYMKLLYQNRDQITESDKEDILILYDNVRKKYPLLDAITAENCIYGLCLTKRWKEASELIDMISITTEQSGRTFSLLIIAAFENAEPEIGWKYINELIKTQTMPRSTVYIAYLDYCIKKFNSAKAFEEEISKLFDFWRRENVVPEQKMIDKLSKTFTKFKWKPMYSIINKYGFCKQCSHQLPPVKFTKEDYSKLSDTFLKKVIVGTDVFKKSNPQELENFVRFVERTKPYNVVIDGLNVLFSAKGDNIRGAKRLNLLVEHFVKRRQNVLILGRKHMSRLSTSLEYTFKNAHVFLADDISQDDPYLLYATLLSGPNTMFISNDMMRQHAFLFEGSDVSLIFQQWKRSHWYYTEFKDTRNVAMRVIVLDPMKHLVAAQQDEHGWHIPYIEGDSDSTMPHTLTHTWLCLRKENFQMKSNPNPSRIGHPVLISTAIRR